MVVCVYVCVCVWVCVRVCVCVCTSGLASSSEMLVVSSWVRIPTASSLFWMSMPLIWRGEGGEGIRGEEESGRVERTGEGRGSKGREEERGGV